MELTNYAVGKITEVSKREWQGQNGAGVTYTITFIPDGEKDANAIYIQTTNKDHHKAIDSFKPSDQVAADFTIKGKSFTSKSGALFKMNELWLSNIQLAIPSTEGLEEGDAPF